MKKIATITFHASYNYGSNLQAYALQEFIKKLCHNDCKYNIINLRTEVQKGMYKSPFYKKNIRNLIKFLILFKYVNQFNKKEIYFENFINEKLNLTKEYKNYDELKNEKFDYDYYISGSDQLWNLQATDFDWSYYLEFIDSKNKISYAGSFGPIKRNWTNEEKRRVVRNLKKYKYISVRE